MTAVAPRTGRWSRPRRRALPLGSLLLAVACTPPDDVARIEGFAQGTTYGVQWGTAANVDENRVAAAVEAELARLDALLSNYRDDSAVERFNAARTTDALQVPEELVALLRVAREVHRASDGCFDPTIRPLIRLWGFDGAEPRVPDAPALAQSLRQIGMDRLRITSDAELEKLEPEIEVDVSGIAQGYTAERLAAVLEGFGLGRFLVEIGGEIVSSGYKPNGEPWRVAIESPDASGAARVLTLPERRSALATSGTYQHFFTADGRRYAHVLDPRTGRPVEHALASATVLAEDAALADAWSTALLCLGPERAMDLATRAEIAAVLLVEENGDLVEWISPRAAAELGL